MQDPVAPMTAAQARFSQSRQLTWMLRGVFSDSSSLAGGFTDKVSTCAVLARIVPDESFADFHRITNRHAFPTHYVINNAGLNGLEGEGGGAVDNLRTTLPSDYFGFSPWLGAPQNILDHARDHPPQPISRIKRASDEWMLADAWYRSRTNAFFPELQQEGPYQWGWTGESLPNFAPHFRKVKGGYGFVSSDQRDQQSSRIRSSKSDGQTGTAFFDGHAEMVPSITIERAGFELLYGFPGTKNPRTPLP